jgi:hypothetical protein
MVSPTVTVSGVLWAVFKDETRKKEAIAVQSGGEMVQRGAAVFQLLFIVFSQQGGYRCPGWKENRESTESSLGVLDELWWRKQIPFGR